MMNLQELQTILTNELPIKIFMINNNGYHSIRQTQNNLFKNHSKVGIGPESNDLSFPDFGKLAEATGEYLLDNSTVDEDLKGLFRTYLKSSPVAKPIFDTNELAEDYVEFKGDDTIYSEYVKNTSLMEYLYDLFVKPGTQNSGKNTEVINN